MEDWGFSSNLCVKRCAYLSLICAIEAETEVSRKKDGGHGISIALPNRSFDSTLRKMARQFYLDLIVVAGDVNGQKEFY